MDKIRQNANLITQVTKTESNESTRHEERSRLKKSCRYRIVKRVGNLGVAQFTTPFPFWKKPCHAPVTYILHSLQVVEKNTNTAFSCNPLTKFQSGGRPRFLVLGVIPRIADILDKIIHKKIRLNGNLTYSFWEVSRLGAGYHPPNDAIKKSRSCMKRLLRRKLLSWKMCRSVRSKNRDVLFKKVMLHRFSCAYLSLLACRRLFMLISSSAVIFFFFLFCLLAFLFCFVLFSFLFLVKKIATSGKRESMKKPLSMCR